MVVYSWAILAAILKVVLQYVCPGFVHFPEEEVAVPLLKMAAKINVLQKCEFGLFSKDFVHDLADVKIKSWQQKV